MTHEDDEARMAWAHRGDHRPAFARMPAPGQESVWDYPRPPELRPAPHPVRVMADDHIVADTSSALRLCETASPPTFYIPRADIDPGGLVASRSASWCEWKGRAAYWHIVAGDTRIDDAAWGYPDAAGAYSALADAIAFYPGRLACFVGDERVRAQAGGFYGGWVTDEIVGPYKGEPGTQSW